ncbi:MFS transporter [Pseudochrobactrum sp. sp1633]|uniref:MFS transporter n=1 Tax=Pseudochrobactrum sp. sp1633 TaxID=3036706 RepID=UPI0025A50831|nr:MFS transporter [Pseudochrobactrum sp. sp1633]MDM8345753.1 MFS transporter [Pseudochrobactrum sp. sp1633]HWD12457.1 MFS transporter [Pseudochrobactrum sp.]
MSGDAGTSTAQTFVVDDGARYYRWAVAGAFFANGFVTGSWALHIPLLMNRLGVSEGVFGLLILVFGLGALAAMSWCGPLIARYGSDRITKAFAVGVAFWLVFVALTGNLYLAVPVLFLFGAVVGGMDVAMNANAVAVEKTLGRALMSSSHGFWSLGGFAGSGLGSFYLHYQGAFSHALMVTVIAGGIMLVALPKLVADRQPHTGEKIRFTLPNQPVIYLIGMMALFAMIPEGAVLDWAAVYIQQAFNADLTTAGYGFAAFSGTMALVRFLGDGVRNRFGAVRTFRVSIIIAAAGLFVSGFAPHAWIAILAFAVAGLGVANIVPIIFSAAGNQSGIHAGTALSLVTLMGYSGILVAPSLIGFIGGHIGFGPVYMVLALMLVVVFMLSSLASAADQKRE